MGAAVVEARYAAETFLACRIPYLQADNGGGVWVEDFLGHEGGADGGLNVLGERCSGVDVAGYEAGLANSLGSEDDEFGFDG